MESPSGIKVWQSSWFVQTLSLSLSLSTSCFYVGCPGTEVHILCNNCCQFLHPSSLVFNSHHWHLDYELVARNLWWNSLSIIASHSHLDSLSVSLTLPSCLDAKCIAFGFVQLILITDPRMGDLREALKYIYSNIYVEYVVKNPLYTPGQPFKWEPGLSLSSETTVIGCCAFCKFRLLQLFRDAIIAWIPLMSAQVMPSTWICLTWSSEQRLIELWTH